MGSEKNTKYMYNEIKVFSMREPFINEIVLKNEKTKELYTVEGIIMNQTLKITGIYDFSKMSEEEKESLIKLGKYWWSESNRQIPINVFLFNDLLPFEKYMVNFKNQYIEEIKGHVVQLYKIIPTKIELKNKKL